MCGYTSAGKNNQVGRLTTLGRLEVVTTYVLSCLQFAENESVSSINQPSRAFALTPTVPNSDWRQGQLLRKKFQIQAALAIKGHSSYLVPSKKIVEKLMEQFDFADDGKHLSVGNIRLVQQAMAKTAMKYLLELWSTGPIGK